MKFNTFNNINPDRVVKHLSDGSIALGKMLLGEDGVPRFFTFVEIAAMEGVGDYNPLTGYCEYNCEVTALEIKIINPVFLKQLKERSW